MRGRGGAFGATAAIAGWKIVHPKPGAVTIVLQDDMASDAIDERARDFVTSAVERLNAFLTGTERSKADHLLLFSKAALQMCMEWLNEHIRLHALTESPLTLTEMYRWYSVMLFSHLLGLSLNMTLDLLKRLSPPERKLPSLSRMRFVTYNIKGYSAFNRGDTGSSTWNGQHDRTVYLDDFETGAFKASRDVFLIVRKTIATLDDELFGTRAEDNQVGLCSWTR